MVNSEILIESNNLLLHSFILFTVIVILYLNVISSVETQAVRNEIDQNVSNAVVNYLNDQNNPTLKDSLTLRKDKIDTLYQNTQNSSPDTITNNNYLKIIMIVSIFVFLFFIIVSWIIMKMFIDFSIKKLVTKNLILFFFIAVFEVFFFFTVIIKYKAISATEFKQMFYNSLNGLN